MALQHRGLCNLLRDYVRLPHPGPILPELKIRFCVAGVRASDETRYDGGATVPDTEARRADRTTLLGPQLFSHCGLIDRTTVTTIFGRSCRSVRLRPASAAKQTRWRALLSMRSTGCPHKSTR